jgi:hypothetical protein
MGRCGIVLRPLVLPARPQASGDDEVIETVHEGTSDEEGYPLLSDDRRRMEELTQSIQPQRERRTRVTSNGQRAAAVVVVLSVILVSAVTQLVGRDSWRDLKAHPQCMPCGSGDALCAKWGSQVILRSRGYEGSGHQMQPFLDKVLAGEDVKIGVIGGSISACVDSTSKECYGTLLEKQLGVTFAAHGSKVRLFNGAVSALGSDYFKSCWASGLSDEMDLVIIELVVNDHQAGKVNKHLNELVRNVFEQAYKPSILFFNMYSPHLEWANGAPSIDTLAQYYDIPVVRFVPSICATGPLLTLPFTKPPQCHLPSETRA